MVISRAKKYALCGILGVLLGVFVVLPLILGAVLRGTAERKLHDGVWRLSRAISIGPFQMGTLGDERI
jgi:hypothetical protein